jgi:hypothetical protein
LDFLFELYELRRRIKYCASGDWKVWSYEGGMNGLRGNLLRSSLVKDQTDLQMLSIDKEGAINLKVKSVLRGLGFLSGILIRVLSSPKGIKTPVLCCPFSGFAN